MGIGMFRSSSSFDRKGSKSFFSGWKTEDKECLSVAGTEQGTPDPKPDNFKILRLSEINGFLLVEIKYLDCINYEGKKILIFHNVTMLELVNQKMIDPHFSDNPKYHSPVARFAPTDEGWRMANHFATNYK